MLADTDRIPYSIVRMEKTRPSLLARVRRPDEEQAWEEFYRLYGPIIVGYAMRHGLDAGRAEDVLQETMIVLLRLLPDFRYDPGRGLFRSFLLSIVHQRILAATRRMSARREVPLSASPEGADRLANFPAPGAVAPGHALDLLWTASLRDEAWRRLSSDGVFDGRTVAVYEAYVVQKGKADEIARRFDMKPNAVHQVKNRVEQRILAEMQVLRSYLGEEVAV